MNHLEASQEMFRLLQELRDEFEPEFEDNPNGADEWKCPHCFHYVQAVYGPPGHLQDPPVPFPHVTTCLLFRVDQLLEELGPLFPLLVDIEKTPSPEGVF